MLKFFSDLVDVPKRTLVGRLVFIILCITIISHLVIFILFTDANKRSQLKINRDLMVQQVLHLVQVVVATPPEHRQATIQSIDVPNISLTMTTTPLYKLEFDRVSMWSILESIGNKTSTIRFSIRLQLHQWLNVQASMTPRSWAFQIFLMVMEVILIVAVIFYLWSISRFVRPLQHFAYAANRLGRNINAPHMNEVGPPVVVRAARAMNNMQDRLRSLIRDRTQMLAAISHDLRTPITRMKLRSQLIEDDEMREKNFKDLDEMEEMISETLAFASEDSLMSRHVKLEFSSLLSTLCEDLIDTFPGKVSYTQKTYRSMPIYGRALALKRAISNVVQNAVKYGHKATVTLSYDKEDKAALITVDDQGPGISEGEMEKVFSPFYRAEKSRSRETGGTGLGLAVAREVTHGHGGDITLKNLKPRGLRVSIYLPLTE